jgi:hypothetical protein
MIKFSSVLKSAARYFILRVALEIALDDPLSFPFFLRAVLEGITCAVFIAFALRSRLADMILKKTGNNK